MSTSKKPRRSRQKRQVRRWKVTGLALVPIQVEMYVDAPDAQSAEIIAGTEFLRDRRKYVVPGSADIGAVHDWYPSAEEAPNS